MLKLIATNGQRSLFQTGFANLWEGTDLEETVPTGHVVDEEGVVIPVKNIYAMFRDDSWEIIDAPDEPLGKGRKRQFASRAEAARYAARIRWGTTTPDANASAASNGVPMEPTDDVNEAITTGAPFKPLLFESLPPDIQEGLTKTETSSLPFNDEMVLEAKLTAYYAKVLSPDSISPENQYEIGKYGSHYRQFVNSGTSADPLRADERLQLASSMARQTVIRHREKQFLIGREDEALKETKDLVSQPEMKIAMTVTEAGASAILTGGRITTQFETKTSRGALNPQGRAAHEAVAYGTHPATIPDRRPVYATLHPVGVQHPIATGAEQYGTIQFVMKPQVSDRSTFSVVDSLGQNRNPSPVRGPITRGQAHPYTKFPKDAPIHPSDKVGKIRRGDRTEYSEAQIHGGVRLSDVAYIVANRRTSDLVERAAKHGIPVISIGTEPRDRTGKMKILPEPAEVAKSAADISDTVGRIWQAVDSLVVEKGRKRKFSTRTEAAQYAARIRWGTTSGSSTTEKPHMKAMREEAEALRVEVSALNQTVSFDNMQRSSTKAANGAYAWSDAKGDIQVNTANEELIPSPKVADIHDRVLALGGKMESEAMSRTEAQIAAGKISTKEEMRAAYAKNMQDVVAEVRPCGGKIEIGRKDDATAFKTDSTSQEAFDAVVPNLELVGKVMPTDWSDSTKGGRLMIRSDDKLPNGHFVTPNNSFDTPVIAIPTMDTQKKRGELDNLRVVGHETQHYITYKRPAIQALEVAFITHRTTAFTESRFWKDESRALSLRERMKTKVRDKRRVATTTKGDVVEIDTDMFANAYSGRRYDKAVKRTGPYGMFDNSKTRFTAFELMTTGFEQVLSGNADHFDRDHLGFVLGVMATA
jgi:hypothetical protein